MITVLCHWISVLQPPKLLFPITADTYLYTHVVDKLIRLAHVMMKVIWEDRIILKKFSGFTLTVCTQVRPHRYVPRM